MDRTIDGFPPLQRSSLSSAYQHMRTFSAMNLQLNANTESGKYDLGDIQIGIFYLTAYQ